MEAPVGSTDLGGDAGNDNKDAPLFTIVTRALGSTEKLYDSASDSELPDATSAIYSSDHVVLIKRRGHWVPMNTSRLRNSLLTTMGLLELANASDFAANVWNETPVPIYAIVFMALGGTLALVVSAFALKDAMLSYDNICYLRQERRNLKTEREDLSKSGRSTQQVDILLDANFREIGSEISNRCGLDLFSGFGAIIISVGTFMAIGGANYEVWLTSNLLSGYVGNAPIALYALGSSVWSAYIFHRASQHRTLAARNARLQDRVAKQVVGLRTRNVHVYTAMSAVGSLIGGAASLVTAKRWEGYIVLIPVIISSIFYNSWLRRMVSYDRPPIGNPLALTEEALLQDLEMAAATCDRIKSQEFPLQKMVPDTTSLESVLGYFIMSDMLEHLCLGLMGNKSIVSVIVEPGAFEVRIQAQRLLDIPKELHPVILEVANDVMKKKGAMHFEYRQRYLAEVLGSMLRLFPETNKDESSTT